MLAFAERAKATQPTTSVRPPMRSPARDPLTREADPAPGSRRTIGNQAALRLLAANGKDCKSGPPAAERSKSSEAPPDPGMEVTQPPAPIDAGAPAPPDAGGAVPADDHAPAKKASLKSGPTYSPSGTIKTTKSGGLKTATFKQSAEFENDASKNIDASCGEIRQYIKWSKGEDPPKTGAFEPKNSFKEDTWYEDRDPAGKRYGHRSGPFAECVSINHYEDKKGVKDCVKGEVYAGQDDPKGADTRTGTWSFELRAVDTCGGAEKEIGTAASVVVDFSA